MVQKAFTDNKTIQALNTNTVFDLITALCALDF